MPTTNQKTKVEPLDPDSPAGRAAADSLSKALAEIQVAIWGRQQAAATAERLTRCRYLRLNDQQCTAEVADPTAEILLCTKHLGRALALLKKSMVTRSGRG